MRCPHCRQAEIPAGAKFCIECGAPVARASGSARRGRTSASSLIIDYDDVPQRRSQPRTRIAALVAVGVVVVGIGVWVTLSSLGASPPAPVASEPRMTRLAPPADSTLPADSTPPAEVAPQPTSLPTRPALRAVSRAEPGTLSLNSVPWGRVSIDGRAVGNTPVLDLRIAAGTHRVRVERPGFAAYEGVVTVAAGQRVRITDIALAQRR